MSVSSARVGTVRVRNLHDVDAPSLCLPPSLRTSNGSQQPPDERNGWNDEARRGGRPRAEGCRKEGEGVSENEGAEATHSEGIVHRCGSGDVDILST